MHKYQQADAILYGFVVKFNYEILHGLQVTIISDYVRAKNKTTSEDLPQIPPFRISLELRYSTPTYWFGETWQLSSKQSDIAPNETASAGYVLLGLYAGTKFVTGQFSHIITLKVQNLFDQEYKDHLSAIKDFTSMPGRNIVANYKFIF